jgi:hypothetical protein
MKCCIKNCLHEDATAMADDLCPDCFDELYRSSPGKMSDVLLLGLIIVLGIVAFIAGYVWAGYAFGPIVLRAIV